MARRGDEKLHHGEDVLAGAPVLSEVGALATIECSLEAYGVGTGASLGPDAVEVGTDREEVLLAGGDLLGIGDPEVGHGLEDAQEGQAYSIYNSKPLPFP